MKQNHPFVIRYPRGLVSLPERFRELPFIEITPTWTYLRKGEKIALISYGPSLDLLIQANEELKLNASIINARFIKPIDVNMLKDICKNYTHIFVYEENTNMGSLYPQILKYMTQNNHHLKTTSMSITDTIVEHGHYKDILKILHMDLESIKEHLKKFYL